MKGRLAVLAAASALILTACASSGSGDYTFPPDPHASANTAACAALQAFEADPKYDTFLPVGRTGENADEPIRGDVSKLAQAVFTNKPESQVRAAALKLSADCGLMP